MDCSDYKVTSQYVTSTGKYIPSTMFESAYVEYFWEPVIGKRIPEPEINIKYPEEQLRKREKTIRRLKKFYKMEENYVKDKTT